MNDSIEDRIGQSRIAHELVPSVDGKLAGEVLVQTRGTRACVSNMVRYRQAPRIAFQISGAVPP